MGTLFISSCFLGVNLMILTDTFRITEEQLADMVRSVLEYPTTETIKASTKACGFSAAGYDPFAIEKKLYLPGRAYRGDLPSSQDPNYLKDLFTPFNMSTPPGSANLSLMSPAFWEFNIELPKERKQN